jgi:proline iminopeptidase
LSRPSVPSVRVRALRADARVRFGTVTEDILVEDCEALRQALGIGRWAVLGHSFGGRLALRYADKYPARVTSLLFENPGWDAEASERYRLPALGALYDSLGETSLAQECRDLAARPDMYAEGPRLDLLFGLAPRGAYWYLADEKFQRSMEEAAPELSGDDHTEVAAMKLINDRGIHESLLPMLSGLQVPALLIVGKSDLVTSPEQIDAFHDQVPHGRVEVFDHSGHFVQLEQAEEYSALVTEFVLLTNRKLRRSAHRSVTELETDIRKWINEWNKDPRPFVWTKSADEILETLAAYCQRIIDSGH